MRPDFIWAGNAREYQRFITEVRPEWRGIPALVSLEQLQGRRGTTVHAHGSYYDRGDHDAICDEMSRQQGEWV